MKKKICALLLCLTLGLVMMTGCNRNGGEDAYDIIVIIRATDSDFWQTLASGAEAAAQESDGNIRVTIQGPRNELDIEEQVAIFENAVLEEPDGIVIAATLGDTVVDIVADSVEAGIPVVALDEYIPSELVSTFLATDHAAASAQTADLMVTQWAAAGIDPVGMDIVVVSAVAGAAVNVARTNGFIDRITYLVPDINVIETQFADNDITRAADITSSLIAANPNLIGIFGDNSRMGAGIAMAIEETGRQDIITYAFDANQQIVDAINAGNLTGVVVQDPWRMGFDGVMDVIRAINGEDLPASVAVPVNIVTIINVNDENIQELLSQ